MLIECAAERPLFAGLQEDLQTLSEAVDTLLQKGYGRRFRWAGVPEGAPSSLLELRQCYAAKQTVEIWEGGCAQTIWGTRWTRTKRPFGYGNMLFRAVHDYAHLLLDAPFTLEGENAVAAWTKGLCAAVFPERYTFWSVLLDIEIVEQAKEFHRTGAFPADQRAFFLAHYAARDAINQERS